MFGKKYILAIIWGSLWFASGCVGEASPAATPQESENAIVQPTPTDSLEEEKKPDETEPVQVSNGVVETCVSQKIMVSTEEIGDYYWADNGKLLFYQTSKDKVWYAFDTEQGKSVSVEEKMLERTPAPASLSESNLVKAFSIEPYWGEWPYQTLSVSPSQKKLIFTKVKFAHGTPTPELTPNLEGETWPPEYSSELYVKTKGEETPEYVGEIGGGISEIYWFPGENTVVLYTGVPSPVGLAHIWVVNLEARRFTPLLPSGEGIVPVFEGILPDGERFFYGDLNEPGKRMRMYNINDGTEALLDLPITHYWWQLKGDRILAVARYPGMDEQSLFVYDLNSQHSVQIIEDTFYYNHSSPNAFQANQDFSKIAYKESEVLGNSPGGLYIINLCPELLSYFEIQ